MATINESSTHLTKLSFMKAKVEKDIFEKNIFAQF
jgi:hypothetical protein